MITEFFLDPIFYVIRKKIHKFFCDNKVMTDAIVNN